jgi:hypothetical protein
VLAKQGRGGLAVPQQDAALSGEVALDEAQRVAEPWVEHDIPDRWLSDAVDGGEGARGRMDLGQQPAAAPVLARPVALRPGQQAEQGPPSSVPPDRRLERRRRRPAGGRELVAEAQLIVDVALRDVRAVAPQHGRAAAGLDPPVGVDAVAEQARIAQPPTGTQPHRRADGCWAASGHVGPISSRNAECQAQNDDGHPASGAFSRARARAV